LWLHEAGFIMMYIILQLGVNTAFWSCNTVIRILGVICFPTSILFMYVLVSCLCVLCPYVFIRENTTLPHKLVLEFTSQPKTLISLWLAVWTMQPVQNTHPQFFLPIRHRHSVCASLVIFPPLNLKLNHQGSQRASQFYLEVSKNYGK
jgi:hypothetical protein